MKVPLLRTFSYHYRQKYGTAVGKIPLDLDLVCPNRIKGGCIYCRPASFTPGYLHHSDSIETQLEKAHKQLLRGRFSQYFAYFQQETATAMLASDLLPKLEQVLTQTECIGLILSTRPDYIDQDLLDPLSDLIASSKKECLIEIGLQSIHEKSLRLLNRNHSFDDFLEAHNKVSLYSNLQLGAHLLFGIPGESVEEMCESVQCVCSLGVDALKLHHLQVIAETPLHQMYLDGDVSVFTQQSYMNLLLKIIPMIPPNIVLHRLWTTSHPDILVAPKWNVLPGELSRQLQVQLSENGLEQGCCV